MRDRDDDGIVFLYCRYMFSDVHVITLHRNVHRDISVSLYRIVRGS